MQVNNEFKPKIVAFCCNWCSYAGADLAGTNRANYPADVRSFEYHVPAVSIRFSFCGHFSVVQMVSSSADAIRVTVTIPLVTTTHVGE